jgi:SAM-dependent methyltransferase
MKELHREVLGEYGRCPRCTTELRLQDGLVLCRLGHSYPERGGWYDFSGNVDETDIDTRRTLESFGYEWTAFGAITDEEEDFWWHRNLGDVPLDEMRELVALDAGCGKGRFSRLTASRFRAIVALDGSAAVLSAARNLEDTPNAVVIRSDVRTIPFADEAFGFVMCLGVLHHLSDPKVGFDEVVRVLAPGGRILLYLYSRPERGGARRIGLRAASILRKATVRIPHRPLRGLSLPLAAVLYAGVVLPGRLGERRGVGALAKLPLDTYRGRSWRSLWLDTFDRLSAPVEFRYVWSELQPWFDDAGLEVETVRDEAGFFILARRP